MDGKIEQRVCVKFCAKLSKSANETLEMLLEAFGEHSLGRTVVSEWHSCFKAGRVSVKDNKRSGRPTTAKQQKMLKKFENSSTKTVTEQSMSLQTLLGSVMKFARRS
jgi:hypothetical protein